MTMRGQSELLGTIWQHALKALQGWNIGGGRTPAWDQ
jgi:hypothetical protein